MHTILTSHINDLLNLIPAKELLSGEIQKNASNSLKLEYNIQIGDLCSNERHMEQ